MLQPINNKTQEVDNDNNKFDLENPREGAFKLDDKTSALLEVEMQNWIQEKYPAMSEQADSIIADAFRRLRKSIKNENTSFNGHLMRDHLIELTENECKLANPTPEIRMKNMGLSRAEFKDLVEQLKNGNEALIEKVYLVHFKRTTSFLRNRTSCTVEQAHEATLEALIEIRKELIGDRIFYGNLGYYFTKRAKNKLYKIHQKEKDTTTPIEGMDFKDPVNFEDTIYSKQIQHSVAEALDKMCPDCQQILRLFYYEELGFKEIAKMMNKKHDAVRQEARRCRDKLRKHLGAHFYKQFSTYFK